MSSLTTQPKERVIVPKVAWLTVNRVCNFRCPWCYAQGTTFDPQKTLTLEIASSILEIIAALNIQNVTIIGGEPTLWPHLLDLNKELASRHLRSGLVTNAMRFGDDKFWEKYLKCPNTGAGISVKAWDRSSSNSIPRIKDYDRAIRGLERGIGYFGREVSVVLNTTCIDNIVDIARFVSGLGARRLVFSPCAPAIDKDSSNSKFVVPHSEFVKKFVVAYPEVERVMNGNIVLTMKVPLCVWPKEFIAMLIEKKQISSGCQLQHRTGIIFDTDGSLMICNGLYDFPIGKLGSNFSDKDSLLDLLSGPEVVAMYDRLTSYPSEKCCKCSMWENCGGGCPLFWVSYFPDKVITGW